MVRILEFPREELLEGFDKERFMIEIYVGSRRTCTYGFLGIKGLFVEPILDAVLVISHMCRAVIMWCVHVIEVYGVSLFVPSRIRNYIYGYYTRVVTMIAHVFPHPWPRTPICEREVLDTL